VSEHARRIGLNEAVFRSVNEEIEALSERFGLTGRTLDLVCECGDAACAERIQLPHEEYVELRSDPRTFAVVPGHIYPEVERVVAQKSGYDVLMKQSGEPAAIAEATDTRS
jgi:hypothetical protein